MSSLYIKTAKKSSTFEKIFRKNFAKVLDKHRKVCYNVITKDERHQHFPAPAGNKKGSDTMEKTIVTIVNTFTVNAHGERIGDEFPEIVAFGFVPEKAFDEALRALRIACCEDSSDPATMRPGHGAEYFAVEGARLADGEDEDEATEALGWDDRCTFEHNGARVILPSDYNERAIGYNVLCSDKIRTFTSWDEWHWSLTAEDKYGKNPLKRYEAVTYASEWVDGSGWSCENSIVEAVAMTEEEHLTNSRSGIDWSALIEGCDPDEIRRMADDNGEDVKYTVTVYDTTYGDSEDDAVEVSGEERWQSDIAKQYIADHPDRFPEDEGGEDNED